MELHPESWKAALIAIICISNVLAMECMLVRLSRSETRLARIRRLAEDHSEYVPDDLIGRPNGEPYRRASMYWSKMVLRELDHPDQNVVMQKRR